MNLERVRRSHPEWGPWLDVVAEVLRETSNPAWQAAVQALEIRPGTRMPLLAGTTVRVPIDAAAAFLRKLAATASRYEGPSASLVRAGERLDVLAVFEAGLSQAGKGIDRIAGGEGDPETLESLAALLPVPFLLACNDRLASMVSEGWSEGYCPVCGAWPALAEIRGIERSRFLRCGRCGAAWHSHTLSCPFCSNNNHDRLVSLVPEGPGAPRSVEACCDCTGYVKAFTRLQGCRPAEVILEDLESVELDLAALEQGYSRPTGTGCQLHVVFATTGLGRPSVT
jgi:FdhE protein